MKCFPQELVLSAPWRVTYCPCRYPQPRFGQLLALCQFYALSPGSVFHLPAPLRQLLSIYLTARATDCHLRQRWRACRAGMHVLSTKARRSLQSRLLLGPGSFGAYDSERTLGTRQAGGAYKAASGESVESLSLPDQTPEREAFPQ